MQRRPTSAMPQRPGAEAEAAIVRLRSSKVLGPWRSALHDPSAAGATLPASHRSPGWTILAHPLASTKVQLTFVSLRLALSRIGEPPHPSAIVPVPERCAILLRLGTGPNHP
jgi:hypothetical protein